MENNECNNRNHLDADVLLPPRKRLLAGLKRQNSDVYSQTPSPSTSSSNGNDFDNRMNNLLKIHSSSPNLSNEKIVEASRTAAIEAAKVARTARVIAEEKAVIAAKATAEAKKALELVATITDENVLVHQEKYLKKSKLKIKHVAVQSLYSKPKDPQNCRTDEEIARKLHHVINSSPRISNNGSSSEPTQHPKLKKLRISPSSEKTTLNDKRPNFETFTSNGVSAYGDSSISSVKEKYRERDRPNRENREAEIVLPQKRYREDDDDDDGGIHKKKLKLKQKKLPLSICNVRDLESPKEKVKSKNMSCVEDSRNEDTAHVGPSGGKDGERTKLWKCKAFKSPASVKQNKVMQL